MTTTAADPLVGLILDGKYRIEAKVGAGAMGAVYRARHLSLGALRAIKVMKAELAAHPVFVERFQREARLVESLRHPHLVTLHDFARLPDGTWYIVSEFVLGETLASLLKRLGPLPPPEVAQILGQIIDGMTLAHARGVVHRDISPDNIMVSPGEGGQRFAKLLDFGLAKDVVSPAGDGTGRTASSVLLGKIGYASPEQMGSLAPGEPIDGRTDVFSTAAVAHRMLTDCLPWRSDSLQSYVHDLLLRPESDVYDQIRRQVPRAWHGFFVRGLARDRALRTPSMARLKSEMLAAVSGAAEETAASHPASPRSVLGSVTGPAAREARGASLPRGLRLAGVLGLILAGVVALFQSFPSMPPVSPAAGTPVPSPSGPSAATPTPAGPIPTTASAKPVGAESAPTRKVPEPRRDPERPDSVATPVEPMPEPARLEAPGTIVVYSTPESLVFLDGQPRGRTPTTLTQLPPGRHVLSLTTDDEQRFEETIDVAAGATVEKRHSFPGFGSLAILSDVWVEVRVDDGPQQQTPVFLRRIGAGRHTVRASKPGYREQILDVVVEEGRARTLRIELQREQESRSARPEGPALPVGGDP